MPTLRRRTWTAPPLQLNFLAKAAGFGVNASGRFAIPLFGSPVTTATALTAPSAHRACGATAAVTAKAEPPSAKKSASSAIAVEGHGRKRRNLRMATLLLSDLAAKPPGSKTPLGL